MRLLQIMTFLLIAMAVASLTSGCDQLMADKKIYTLEVIYMNGQTDTVSYKGTGENIFSQTNGDITVANPNYTLLSGVRQFRVLKFTDYGPLTPADTAWPRRLTLLQQHL